MALIRLAVRVDRRLLLACFGLAAAILVPVAGVLATATLAPTLDPTLGSIAVSDDAKGLDLDRLPTPAWALGWLDEGDRHVVAFVEGPPLVGPTQAYDGGSAGRTLHVLDEDLTTVTLPNNQVIGPGMTLVHPSVLGVAPVEAAFFPQRAPEAGTRFLPARGADAFELVGIASLQKGTAALAAVSLPLVLLVASAFARLEARSLANVVAVVAALGKPERAGQVLIARILLVCAVGAGICVAGLALAIQTGSMPIGWDIFASRALALAVALPTGAAAIAGSAVAWAATTRTRATLRSKPALGDEKRLGFLPVAARPMITGWRLLGVFCLVGLVVALDVGLPIAASGVPAALAGDPDEWVVGAAAESLTAGRSQEAPALVMADDPDIDAIVGEVFVPTVVRGEALVVRGGNWDAFVDYHGLELLRGGRPGPDELAIGSRAASQLDLDVGDHVVVPGVDGVLGRFEVSGVFATVGLLGDEAIIRTTEARELAGLPPGMVHALRMRPNTRDAREALERDAPHIVFDELTVSPASAPAGTVAVASLRATNLGGGPGSRVANLRVDDNATATTLVRLAAYERRIVDMPFIVPEGPYTIEVNPTATGSGSTPTLALEGPEGAVVGTDAKFRVLLNGTPTARMTLSLYPDLDAADRGSGAMANATTDAKGEATLTVPRTGLLAAAARGPAGIVTASLYGVAPANASTSRLLIEAVYTEPGNLVVDEPSLVSARVRNVGGTTGTERVDFRVDGTRLAYKDVRLQPGEAGTVSVEYTARSLGAAIEANGVRAASAASAAVSGAKVDAGDVRAGGSLQKDVADRLLGNAGVVLGGLAVVTAVSALVVLVLATQRTMAQRSGIVAVLATVWTPNEIRRRAAKEGAVLGALAGIVGVVGAKLFIGVLGQLTTVRAFGHALPDPYTVLFLVQVAVGTAFLGGLTMYNSVGKRLESGSSGVLRAGTGEVT